jgi:hypothetical protein
MPQLPRPPSRRRTAARIAKLENLYFKLLSDKRLDRVEVSNPKLAESAVCTVVQELLDEYVRETFNPGLLRQVTWAEHTHGIAIPRVELGNHSYYPDHVISRRGFTIAIEVKRYNNHSSTLRDTVGQAVIYSQAYGFVIVFIADVTKKGTLARHLNVERLDERDEQLLSELWWYHNTLVACRRVKEVITRGANVNR